jgi:hypothetical protein
VSAIPHGSEPGLGQGTVSTSLTTAGKRSIENRDGGILREYFSQKYKRRLTTQKKIDKVIGKINTMPMKCLGLKSSLYFLPNVAVLHLSVESGGMCSVRGCDAGRSGNIVSLTIFTGNSSVDS